jgi:aminodeoxyfutalosine deaminase
MSKIHKISADCIHTVSSESRKNAVLILDGNGKILSIDDAKNHDPASVRQLCGHVVPGFINAHCHLELSHMKGIIDSGTGLINFIKKVVSLRDFPQEIILEAIEAADREMYENGIVAVGDICNKTDTAYTKSKSSIAYYSFIEMFDLMQEHLTEETIRQYSKVLESQAGSGTNKKNLVPHAPYSVSKPLMNYISNTVPHGCTISIHNQETAHEDAWFLDGSGQFPNFYSHLGLSSAHFQATGKTSIHYTLENLPNHINCLFVHNTFTRKEDIEAALQWNKNSFWATCPNANLYIENRLPNYQLFIDASAKLCVGTDSLSSNWKLSIWDELLKIQKYCAYVPGSLLIKWSTLHGAQALSYDDKLGSIEPGKTPGINLVQMSERGTDFVLESNDVVKIF